MTRTLDSHTLPVEVSRETHRLLDQHVALVVKWSQVINLVARESLDHIRERHVLDSAQLLPIILEQRQTGALHWCDIGSGAGFPGLVVAILAAEIRPDLHMTLVESDARKAAFLRHAALSLGLSVTVRRSRVERLPGLCADVISARAVASLERLIQWAAPHLAEDGICIFPKGARWSEEVNPALASWRFRLHDYPSMTDPRGAILTVKDLHRV